MTRNFIFIAAVIRTKKNKIEENQFEKSKIHEFLNPTILTFNEILDREKERDHERQGQREKGTKREKRTKRDKDTQREDTKEEREREKNTQRVDTEEAIVIERKKNIKTRIQRGNRERKRVT